MTTCLLPDNDDVGGLQQNDAAVIHHSQPTLIDGRTRESGFDVASYTLRVPADSNWHIVYQNVQV